MLRRRHGWRHGGARPAGDRSRRGPRGERSRSRDDPLRRFRARDRAPVAPRHAVPAHVLRRRRLPTPPRPAEPRVRAEDGVGHPLDDPGVPRRPTQRGRVGRRLRQHARRCSPPSGSTSRSWWSPTTGPRAAPAGSPPGAPPRARWRSRVAAAAGGGDRAPRCGGRSSTSTGSPTERRPERPSSSPTTGSWSR